MNKKWKRNISKWISRCRAIKGNVKENEKESKEMNKKMKTNERKWIRKWTGIEGNEKGIKGKT